MEGKIKIVELDDNEKSNIDKNYTLYNTLGENSSVFSWEKEGYIVDFEGKDENKPYLTQDQFDTIKENLEYESIDINSYQEIFPFSYTHKLVYSNKNGIEEWCKYFTSLETLKDYIKNSSLWEGNLTVLLKNIEKDIQE